MNNMPLIALSLWIILAVGIISVRTYTLIPGTRPKRSTRRKDASDTCTLAVFLGSGGHTSEALTLVSTLNFSRYAHRKYILSEGDDFSAQKARELEANMTKQENSTGVVASYEIVMVPRARRVHQSLITTPLTAIWSLVSILKYLLQCYFTSGRPFADALLLNGPGTCFILCVSMYVLRFFGIPTPTVVYIESFARVNSLSLSGKLLRPFVDRFIVQWPQLLNDGGRGECHGWLV